jgi:hypothetical protein
MLAAKRHGALAAALEGGEHFPALLLGISEPPVAAGADDGGFGWRFK